jgi:hypothetical protein
VGARCRGVELSADERLADGNLLLERSAVLLSDLAVSVVESRTAMRSGQDLWSIQHRFCASLSLTRGGIVSPVSSRDIGVRMRMPTEFPLHPLERQGEEGKA